jgi:hypothetical protein
MAWFWTSINNIKRAIIGWGFVTFVQYYSKFELFKAYAALWMVNLRKRLPGYKPISHHHHVIESPFVGKIYIYERRNAESGKKHCIVEKDEGRENKTKEIIGARNPFFSLRCFYQYPGGGGDEVSDLAEKDIAIAIDDKYCVDGQVLDRAFFICILCSLPPVLQPHHHGQQHRQQTNLFALPNSITFMNRVLAAQTVDLAEEYVVLNSNTPLGYSIVRIDNPKQTPVGDVCD